MIELKGITWDHSRALPPLVAVGQRYEELHPGVRVRWEKRSLHEFGHMPIDQLADRFDLIVIDHPWAAYCFQRDLVLDLSPFFSDGHREADPSRFIGPSYQSYLYQGHLLAMPIDAATPVPSWRPDLMSRHGLEVPTTMEEVIHLADGGHAVMPGFGADLFLNWSMLLAAYDAHPFSGPDTIAEEAPALEAMDLLRRLAQNMPARIFQWNPIAIAEKMTRGDEIAYCAFAYSYGNYCRPHFCQNPLRYGNLVSLSAGRPLRSIVGGTGLALTRKCQSVDAAVDFIGYCASAEIQKGIYPYSGGQPARVEAWQDNELDALSGHFFQDTYTSHDRALLRPRYDGYVPLQEKAGIHLQDYMKGECDRSTAWERINQDYRASLPEGDFPDI